MSPQAISAAAFALTAGAPTDARRLLHVDPAPCPRGRRLLLSVEPLEPTERGFELAGTALAVLRDTFANAPDLPTAVALDRAFAAANRALLAENRPRSACRRQRASLIGATAAVLAGRELVVAQVPPSQAILVQDRRLYAFPDLASWRPDFVPAGDDPEPLPLGCAGDCRPSLFRTVAAAGDLVLLCSSSLARRIGRDDTAVDQLLLLGHRRRADPATVDAALDRLGFIAAAGDLDDAHAAVVAVDRLPSTFGGGRAISDGWQRLGDALRDAPRRPFPAPSPTPAANHAWATAAVPAWSPSVGIAAAPAASNQGPHLGRPPAPALARFAGGVARLGPTERQAPTTPPTTATATARLGLPALLLRRPARSAPGAASVRRYRQQSSVTADWRTNLPRGPQLHVPRRIVTVAAIAFAAFGGSGFVLDRQIDRSARVDASFAAVDHAMGQMATNPDAAIAAADSALDQARRADVPDHELRDRQRAVDAARDRAWGVARFARLDRVGSLPAEVGTQAASLVRASDRVFVLSGALYELDAVEGRLVRLLGPGDRVGGGTVGELGTAAAEPSDVIVGDGTALFSRDGSGAWLRRPIAATAEQGAWPPMPSAAFGGSLYTLTSGQGVVKFGSEQTPYPDEWANLSAAPDLASARDLVIDGRVHALLTDGRVQTLERGVSQATLEPAVVPPVVRPLALAGGPDSTALYLLDAGARIGTTHGRVVQLTAAGEPRQILAPTDATDEARQILAEAHDLVVDEAGGVVYLLTKNAVWRGELP